MMSNTAFNLLAILAVAGSAFAAPLSERSDPNEPLVKVHALPDHSTSGQNGVVMASVGSTNAHVVQTPGNDENILHVQVRPDGTDKPLDAYVNVPSSPLGGKIPQGGVAKSFSHTGDAVAGALQGTDAEDVQDAYKVIDADPLAQAYVGGPYLKAGQKRSSPVQDASGKVILDTEKLVGKPKILNNGGGAAGSLLKTNLKPGALLDTGGAIKSDTGIIRTGLIKTNLVGRDKLRTSASTKATVNPEKAPFKQGNSVGNIKLGDTALAKSWWARISAAMALSRRLIT
ncbi:hypothetical protein BD324DRAFT_167582 [Kockovaella imperatae]|uniref:Uncharacterized protein n=1 Tax=Kockovaella imperatae TaxID=4999 RepID=A0A1Y1U7Z4_9TREE|nr:hypothetical protein BD324DRAFT_167582 [Kockovaella imperatae]ORX34161.1 hypothetical protein BD324DRAFT_167582 [Kockovaella imperatae]